MPETETLFGVCRATPTRYAIRRTDGEYLKLAQLDGQIVGAWVLHLANADTWPYMAEAIIAALAADLSHPDGGSVPVWTVEAIEGSNTLRLVSTERTA